MNAALEILYRDEWLVIINKPQGLPSHPTVDKKRASISQLLEKQLNQTAYLMHRLDVDTSGVMLFSLSQEANTPLSEMMSSHHFTKEYLALTEKGDFPTHIEVVSHLSALPGSKPMKMAKVQSGGDYAKTEFWKVHGFKNYNLVRARLHTGRTHQIRAHLLEIGFPILGDEIYNPSKLYDTSLKLHAERISFHHPINRKLLDISAPIPDDFQKFLKDFVAKK